MAFAVSRLALALVAVVVLGALGCASGAARFAGELPGSRLSEMRTFYVQKQPQDERGVYREIQEELRSYGVEVDAGEGAPEREYDAIVTYRDRYIWDLTTFCLQLTIYVRDTRTGYITATGWSRRPSTVRKTPRSHARLIFEELFAGEKP